MKIAAWPWTCRVVQILKDRDRRRRRRRKIDSTPNFESLTLHLPTDNHTVNWYEKWWKILFPKDGGEDKGTYIPLQWNEYNKSILWQPDSACPNLEKRKNPHKKQRDCVLQLLRTIHFRFGGLGWARVTKRPKCNWGLYGDAARGLRPNYPPKSIYFQHLAFVWV